MFKYDPFKIFNNNQEGYVLNTSIKIIKTSVTKLNYPVYKIYVIKEGGVITKLLWVNTFKDVLCTRKLLFSILKLNNIKHSKNIKLYKLINLINSLENITVYVEKYNKYLELTINN